MNFSVRRLNSQGPTNFAAKSFATRAKISIQKVMTLLSIVGSQGVHAETRLNIPTVAPIVQPKQFCQRFSNTMTTLAGQQGLDGRESARTGLRASSKIVSQMKSGKMDIYLDAASFETGAATAGERMWFNIPEILLSSMGTAPNRPVFIEDIGELKSTPNIMPGAQILVLVKEFGDITASRAKLVTQNALALGVQINIIWVGQSKGRADSRLTSDLALMANSTGGSFLNFGAVNTCSGT